MQEQMADKKVSIDLSEFRIAFKSSQSPDQITQNKKTQKLPDILLYQI